MKIMHNQLRIGNKTRLLFALLFIISSLTSALIIIPQSAKAATFTMQTGYYIGSGTAGNTISGVGFKPDYLIIRSTSVANVGMFKTSAMPAANAGFFNGAADNTASLITLNNDGFTLGLSNTVNSPNNHYIWTAFSGSDCTSSGTFCVGTYTGDGTGDRDISTGFQPGIVINKRSSAVAAHFRTASMPANQTDYFTSTDNDTAGTLIKSFASTSFKVGSIDNTTGIVYNHVSFATGTSAAAEGTFVGDGTDNRNISGLGIAPDLLFVKNDTSATVTNKRTVMTTDQHLNDLASFPADTLTDLSNYIQLLQSDGFQVGSSGANETGMTMYWFAFSGAPPQPPASGTYTMAEGSYTGTGANITVSGIGFAPDLVLIKDNAANSMVFRTTLMAGDTTLYLSNAASTITLAITSLTTDGFTLGTNAAINTSANTYHWQAFGNAYRPDTKRGAADFAIGSYYSGGADNTDVIGVPYQMDFVATKRLAAASGAFRSSSQTGDLSGYFSNTAETNNAIQSLTSTGFQVGTNASVSGLGSHVRWFGFKNSSTFKTGSYTGNGVVDKAESSVGFQPDLVWIKQSTTSAAISRPASLLGDNSQYIVNLANSTGKIKTLTSTGFTLGTGTEVNTNGGIYRYAAWKMPVSTGVITGDIVDSGGNSVTNPSFSMNNTSIPFECSETTGILGTSAQRLRISNTTTNATWTTSIAATDGATALWRNSGNSQQYDYNEPSGSPVGCTDGSDADSLAGKLRIEPSTGLITPQSGCSTSNISLGTNQDFNQSTTNAITLISAASGANTNCYWDLIGINLRQYIPTDQTTDNYSINFTVTTVAS
jgi:hypothetical protein